MYICEKCGEVFDAPMIIGSPSDPALGEGCPNCGHEYFDDAVQCRICGEWVAEGDTDGGCHNEVCHSCINERGKDIDFLLSATGRYTTDVEIPDFYSYVLDEDELKKTVNDALYALVKKKLANDAESARYPWHDQKNNEIDTRDFLRYYGTEIAEALVDEQNPRKEGAA